MSGQLDGNIETIEPAYLRSECECAGRPLRLSLLMSRHLGCLARRARDVTDRGHGGIAIRSKGARRCRCEGAMGFLCASLIEAADIPGTPITGLPEFAARSRGFQPHLVTTLRPSRSLPGARRLPPTWLSPSRITVRWSPRARFDEGRPEKHG